MPPFLLQSLVLLLCALLLPGCGDEEAPPVAGRAVDGEVLDEALERLKAVPYMDVVNDEKGPGLANVTLYDENLSFDGVILYILRDMAEANLVDMNGKLLHQWRPSELMPRGKWIYAEIDEDGSLCVLLRREGIYRISRDSTEVTKLGGQQVHHDLELAPDGKIYALTEKNQWLSFPQGDVPIRNHYILVLSRSGEVLKSVSLFDLFKDRIPPETVERMLQHVEMIKAKRAGAGRKFSRRSYPRYWDLFHSSTVEYITSDFSRGAKGDLLICVRNMDMIAVVNLEEESVRWSWGEGELDRPHQPTLLENGNILIFDNGTFRDYTRIVEVNPETGTIDWEYRADPPQDFHSATKGGVQRLPNGNTLIVESLHGRVFEVTKDGRVVWEFWNPNFNMAGERGTIYRMTRYGAAVLAWLGRDAA